MKFFKTVNIKKPALTIGYELTLRKQSTIIDLIYEHKLEKNWETCSYEHITGTKVFPNKTIEDYDDSIFRESIIKQFKKENPNYHNVSFWPIGDT